MRIFWVVKAKKVLFGLAVAFVLLLVLYSWNMAAETVFPWGKKQVIFMGHALDPKAPGLAQQVQELTDSLYRPPVDAVYDDVNKSVVPEINGFEILDEETLAKIKAARSGTTVVPVWRELLPETTVADFPDLPIYAGNPERKQIALVVNVSWGNEYLEEMLTIFEVEGIQASFFLVGSWVANNPELARKLADSGHELGNHGYSDPHMKDMQTEAIQAEIRRTNDTIQEFCGIQPQWFSPPYGEKEEKIYRAAADLGMHTVLWSLDTIDWQLPGEDAIVDRIVNNLHNGAIILMHPTAQTPGALPRIIAGAKQRDLEIVTVGELLDPDFWPVKYSMLWLGH